MNRNGKIARLSVDIREQLNVRLQDNEPGDKLLEWLNGQDAVRSVLKEQFEGKAITKQNLSEWRTGGFAEWVLGQKVVYEAQDTDEGARRLDAVSDSSLPDRLATVLAGRYASLLARWDGEITEAFTKKLRSLSSLCRDICAQRRCHHNAIKVKIAQERHAERHDGKGKSKTESKSTTQSEPVRPEPMRDYFDPNDTWDGGWNGGGEAGKEEGRVKNELGKTVPSEPVAPSQTSFQPKPEMTTPADVATSCRHPEPQALENAGAPESVAPGLSAKAVEATADQTEYKSPIVDNWIYPPMAASDPNSGDIYAIDTVPKKRNPADYDPDPFMYPSYWHWIKTCKPKVLPPNHPAKPPTTWNY